MTMRIVFFGNGPVAAKSLDLLAKNFEIEAVITTPAKHIQDEAPVLALANRLEVASFLPDSKSALDQLILNHTFSSQLGVIIDYGIIVSQDVINSFKLGIVNSHFSLLPEWRGADPISFALLSGQEKTGVSLMLINDKMDEGTLLIQGEQDIRADDTGPSLTERLIILSNRLLKTALPDYASGKLKPYPQAKSGASYSRKLTKQDGIIDWSKPAEQIEREIRAFIEWPKSHAQLNGVEVIITKAHVEPTNCEKPGRLDRSGLINGLLRICCGKDTLLIDRLKPAGKNEMAASDFLRGYGAKLRQR